MAIPGMTEALADTLHTAASNTQFRSPGEARRLDVTSRPSFPPIALMLPIWPAAQCSIRGGAQNRPYDQDK